MAAGFPHSKSSKRKQGKSGNVSSNLTLEVTHHHIQTKPGNNVLVGGGGPSLPEYQEARITGNHPGGWLQHNGKSPWVKQEEVRFKHSLEEPGMTGEVRLE